MLAPVGAGGIPLGDGRTHHTYDYMMYVTNYEAFEDPGVADKGVGAECRRGAGGQPAQSI